MPSSVSISLSRKPVTTATQGSGPQTSAAQVTPLVLHVHLHRACCCSHSAVQSISARLCSLPAKWKFSHRAFCPADASQSAVGPSSPQPCSAACMTTQTQVQIALVNTSLASTSNYSPESLRRSLTQTVCCAANHWHARPSILSSPRQADTGPERAREHRPGLTI